MMLNSTYKIFLLSLLVGFLLEIAPAQAQSEVISNVRSSLKTGSSKELSKYLGEMIALKIDGQQSNYSRTQAEYVLKDFFKQYPPTDFQYVHQGASEGGLKYAIGRYSYDNGSFRVVLRSKKFDSGYKVSSLDFTKE
ncbi:MAG: DUF4783 domain-containing protein [Cyclobacteriaceae bacterium]